MSLRALMFFMGAALPSLAVAGALEVLSAEIAQDAARQIAKTRQEASACVYVDDSLSPNPGSLSLARAVAASLSSQYGVRDVFAASLSTLSEAPEQASAAGCDVAVVVAFEAPSKEARSRVWVLRAAPKPTAFSLTRREVSSLGEPFLSSMIRLPVPVAVAPPIDLSRGWRMQQISVGDAPIVALVTGQLSLAEGDLSSLFTLSKDAAISYRFEPRATPTSPFSSPKELYRADLSLLPRAKRVSRDLTGVLSFDRARCADECLKETRYLLLRTSALGASYRLSLNESFSRPLPLSADDELNKLWPLFPGEEPKLLFGALEEGSNLFLKKVWWVERAELTKKEATKTEASLNGRFFAASFTPQDQGKRAVFLQESEDLVLYDLTSLSSAGSLGKAGAQLLLVDLDGDGNAEVISTSTGTPGEGDAITISTLEEKSPRKLWGSGALYAPASASAGKTRPLSWVTALAAGDLDGDGSIELIAALYSAAGSSILVISR